MPKIYPNKKTSTNDSRIPSSLLKKEHSDVLGENYSTLTPVKNARVIPASSITWADAPNFTIKRKRAVYKTPVHKNTPLILPKTEIKSYLNIDNEMNHKDHIAALKLKLSLKLSFQLPRFKKMEI